MHMIEFGVGAGAQTAAHLLPALGQNRIDGTLGDAVAGHLLLIQNRFKLTDKVGGADDLLAQTA